MGIPHHLCTLRSDYRYLEKLMSSHGLHCHALVLCLEYNNAAPGALSKCEVWFAHPVSPQFQDVMPSTLRSLPGSSGAQKKEHPPPAGGDGFRADDPAKESLYQPISTLSMLLPKSLGIPEETTRPSVQSLGG